MHHHPQLCHFINILTGKGSLNLIISAHGRHMTLLITIDNDVFKQPMTSIRHHSSTYYIHSLWEGVLVTVNSLNGTHKKPSVHTNCQIQRSCYYFNFKKLVTNSVSFLSRQVLYTITILRVIKIMRG